MKPFSKLKKQIDNLFAPELKMEFCCYAYPMRSQYGNTSIPRFCIKLNKEIIWDCPKGFDIKEDFIHSWSDTNGVCDLVRDYIDAPPEKLFETLFEKEYWEQDNYFTKEEIKLYYGLTKIFRAGDKRLGKEKLLNWSKNVPDYAVHLILEKRFGNKSAKVPPKISASGTKYIVFRLLPKDQQKGWKANGKGYYTCTVFPEENESDFCPYYHDYENFYENWIVNRRAFHLD